MEKVTKVEWTDTAKAALKNVFDFHAKYSEQSAENIVNDIIDTADTIVFTHQYQIDDGVSSFEWTVKSKLYKS